MKSDEFETRSIYEFSDYRLLLKYLYDFNKSKNSKFSYRYFAKIAGFAGGSFLKIVIDGGSALSEDSIQKIAIGFKLSKEETHFFKNLVLLNQSQSIEERKLYAQEIFKSRGYKKIHPLSEAQYNYYSKWYFIPIRELVALDHFREDYEWIAKTVKPNISESQAETAIQELIAIGLLDRDENQRLKQVNNIVSTPDEVVSSAVGVWHREMMQRASESLDSVPRNMRDISAVTFRVSKENLQKAKELVQKFRRELAEAPLGGQEDSIYELNLQLFPLTDFVEGVKDGKE